jgi:hemerythrin
VSTLGDNSTEATFEEDEPIVTLAEYEDARNPHETDHDAICALLREVKKRDAEIERLTEVANSLGRLVAQERKKYFEDFDAFHGPGKCDCHTSPGSFGGIR